MARRNWCNQLGGAWGDREGDRAVDRQLVEAGMGHVDDEVSLVRDHGGGHLLSSVSDPGYLPMFEDLGVHRVESPHRLSGTQFYRAVHRPHVQDFMALGNGAEIAEIVLEAGAPLVGVTLEDAGQQGLLPDDVILVAVNRGDTLITPRGQTTLQGGDTVTVFTSGGVTDALLDGFEAE